MVKLCDLTGHLPVYKFLPGFLAFQQRDKEKSEIVKGESPLGQPEYEQKGHY